MESFNQIKHEESLIEKLKNSKNTKSPTKSEAMLWRNHNKKLAKLGYDRHTIINIFENCEDMAKLELEAL